MSRPKVFVDIETTGLDVDRHEIWEVGVILERNVGWERRWFLPVDLGKADPEALRIGGFYDRHPWASNGHTHTVSSLTSFAKEFEELTRGATLVGANVRFDEAFLSKLLKANGACPGWHYRLLDVEAYAAGALGLPDPLGLHSTAKNLGIDPDSFGDTHTALVDAALAKAVYEKALTLRASRD